MATLRHVLRQIPRINGFRPPVVTTRRSYAKSLYEDAWTQDNESKETNGIKTVNANVFRNPNLEFGSRRFYKGRVKGVIFDWGGTVVDSGVYAPIYSFIELFTAEGVEITEDEGRNIRGSNRKANIAQILNKEAVRKRWVAANGKEPTSEDVDRMFERFIPQLLSSLTKYSNVIEGVSDVVKHIKKPPYNLKIGSTTGYPKEVLKIFLNNSISQGFVPDASVCWGEVPEANPAPFMTWLCAIRLGLSPIESIVKVDDSPNGIFEGLLAGCWTVGIAKTSYYVGLTEQQLEELSSSELRLRLQRAYDALSNSGAHYVIDTMEDLPQVIDDINRRLANGEKP